MPESVVSSGGGEISAADKVIRGTVSQDAIGIVTSSSYEMGIGFWHGVRATITDLPPEPDLKWAMEQNHPNPFNPITLISYSLPRPLHVELKIYNLRGEMIRTLVNEDQTGGAHVAIWNGCDDQGGGVASGTYFARLESEEGVLIRKMMLIK
jgi:hypothetical protein